MSSVSKPDVIILGVGHSGTSIVTQMIFALGWERNGADRKSMEIPTFREMNTKMLKTAKPHPDIASFLASLKHPWALKDPRLVLTLQYWIPHLHPTTVLLHLRRNYPSLRESYLFRGEMEGAEPGRYGHTLPQLVEKAEQQFQSWQWTKFDLNYEDIAIAVGGFAFSGMKIREGGRAVKVTTPPPKDGGFSGSKPNPEGSVRA